MPTPTLYLYRGEHMEMVSEDIPGCSGGRGILGLLEIPQEPAWALGVSTWGMAKGIARAERP